jgi:hypothetical protein
MSNLQRRLEIVRRELHILKVQLRMNPATPTEWIEAELTAILDRDRDRIGVQFHGQEKRSAASTTKPEYRPEEGWDARS